MALRSIGTSERDLVVNSVATGVPAGFYIFDSCRATRGTERRQCAAYSLVAGRTSATSARQRSSCRVRRRPCRRLYACGGFAFTVYRLQRTASRRPRSCARSQTQSLTPAWGFLRQWHAELRRSSGNKHCSRYYYVADVSRIMCLRQAPTLSEMRSARVN